MIPTPLPRRSCLPSAGIAADEEVPEAAAVALHFQFYNFARSHKSLKNPYSRTPTMAAGVADHVWTLEEIAALLD